MFFSAATASKAAPSLIRLKAASASPAVGKTICWMVRRSGAPKRVLTRS